ncbi:MAG: peptidylprolyl isomerase [Firmicutes bacterium]|nr:peptidylprolyl isomerase [Bacillota bacterium]
MKNPKKYICLVIFLVIILISGCGMIRVKESEEDKSIVARVDGEPITKDEFDKIFAVFKTQEEMRQGADIWDKSYMGKKYIDLAKEQILEQMIEDKIQLKKAEELNIVASQEEIEEEYEKFKKLFNSEEKFLEFLDGVKMDVDYFRESIRKSLVINKLKEIITKDIDIADEEIEAYYTTHMDMFYRIKASHILLETEDEAREILIRVNAGEDFNALAKEYSIDPSVKENNGDLGYFRHGEMVEPFEEAAFSLKPGEISNIVKSQYGFHIIKVEDKRIDNLEDVKDELKTVMLMEKKKTDFSIAFKELYDEAEVERFEKNL